MALVKTDGISKKNVISKKEINRSMVQSNLKSMPT